MGIFFYWHQVIGSKCPPPLQGCRLNQSLLEYVKFGALELVSIVSPLFELGIIFHLFCWIPYSPRRFLLKIHNFFQPFDQSV